MNKEEKEFYFGISNGIRNFYACLGVIVIELVVLIVDRLRGGFKRVIFL